MGQKGTDQEGGTAGQDHNGAVGVSVNGAEQPPDSAILSLKQKLSVKIVVMGDGTVGKTSMCFRFKSGTFDAKNYSPTVFENFSADMTLPAGRTVNLQIWDTAGQETYQYLLALSFPNTDVFLLCFAIDNRASFENAYGHWYNDIEKHLNSGKNGPKVPVIILVGTKADLRNDKNTDLVTDDEAEELRQKVGAIKYLECSALTGDNVEAVFRSAVETSLKNMGKGKGNGNMGRRGQCSVDSCSVM